MANKNPEFEKKGNKILQAKQNFWKILSDKFKLHLLH